jgi:hypothetical protein
MVIQQFALSHGGVRLERLSHEEFGHLTIPIVRYRVYITESYSFPVKSLSIETTWEGQLVT